MAKSTYVFEIIGDDGEPLKRLTRRCDNLGAQARAQVILEETPEAAAVISAEAHGRAVHAAYRE
ncbi:MAG: hypothetical protein AAFW81_07925 [Pseudomonadota bacterium]